MDNIEMLKALYDFQAAYPKTISFDEGEYFILYQTSARQRNWWQVVSMKGNIGFVPSNYVMKIKVEPDFLISFLNSSIESLELSKETEINGIMPKEELLERLREKKISMERMYLDNSERDADSSLSFSQSIGDGKHSAPHAQEHRPHSPPHSKRLDSSKKSISSPSMATTLPLMISESPSMGSMQVQTQQSQQQQQQAQSPSPAQNKVNDVAQDNSVTSEHSETTTTTTTTSEDVITTYKEPSLNDSSASYTHSKENGTLKSDKESSLASTTTTTTSNKERKSKEKANKINEADSRNHVKTQNGIADKDDKTTTTGNDRSEGSDAAADGSDERNAANGQAVKGDSNDNSQALDSEDSAAALQQLHAAAAAAALAHTGGYPRPNLKVESSDVYQIVDVIRRNTNLSFDLSCEALRVVLTSLEQLYNGAINPYLEAVAIHVTEKVETPKELLGMTHDAKKLQYIFSQLADCKNDSEQRTWMLYEDEDDIVQFLEDLIDILSNADETICCYEMSCDQYQALVNLVQYYQMETRWNIKRLLLKTFTAACHLDHIIVDILLTSVLPLEIVEDMKTNFANLDRFKQLVKMLTIIFSLGQPMPVNHQDYLGVHFASFLLEIIEGNNPEILVDMVISLVLAFNLQFNDSNHNVVVEAMQTLPSAKVFTEKILLLLNREEDPIKLLKHSTDCMNSVLKMFIDIFSVAETAAMFYTNDTKVLIDIIVRQLTDLCAGNPMRRCYLELCRRILRNTDYQEHQHRKQDFMKIFTRIFCEETECSASDQKLVREIANEFPQIFKA